MNAGRWYRCKHCDALVAVPDYRRLDLDTVRAVHEATCPALARHNHDRKITA